VNRKIGITLDFGAGGTGLDALKKLGNNSRLNNSGNPLKKGGNGMPCCPCCDEKGGGRSDPKEGNKASPFALLTKIGAAVAVTLGTLKKGTEAINAAQNAALSTAQQNRGIAEAVIPGFSILMDFVEAIDGTTERIRVSGDKLKINEKVIAATTAGASQLSGERFEIESMRNRIGLTRDIKFNRAEFPDRRTVEGELRSDEESRRREAADAKTLADREAASARMDFGTSRDFVNRASQRVTGAGQKFNKAQEKFQGVRDQENRTGKENKAGRIEAVNELKAANDELMGAEQRMQEESLRYKEKAVRAAEAESNARKTGIEQQRVELNLLKDKEVRMQSSLVRLGKMNRGQYELAKSAAIQLKRNGIENATPELIDLASQIDPKMVDKLAENAAGGRASELAGLGIDSFKMDFADSTLETVRQQINNATSQIRVEVNLDQEAFAQSVADRLNVFFGKFLDSIEMKIASSRREAQIQQAQQYAGAK
jgi:hypothetical protein